MGLSVLAVTAVVGGTVAFKALDKSVEVVLDGQSQTVSTYANTVDGVLNDAGIDLEKRDSVTPSIESSIEEGSTVNITRARMVDYTVDGSQNRQWVTALTVDEALDQLGIAGNADVSASRSQRIPLDGTTIEVTTSKDVTIVVDGATTQASSTSIDVADLLSDQGITLEQQDNTDPSLDTAVTPGMTVTVNRVRTSQVQETQDVGYEVTKQEDSSLTEGTTQVVTKGETGQMVVTYNVTTTNGVESAKEQAGIQWVKAPVAEVVKVGTKPAPAPEPAPAPAPAPAPSQNGSGGSSSGGSGSPAPAPAPAPAPTADGLNWAALAQCESGGNPKAVNPSGKYHGLYQFSVATWQSVGGSGLPSNASPAEQTMRAQILYNKAGAGQWPVCGKQL